MEISEENMFFSQIVLVIISVTLINCFLFRNPQGKVSIQTSVGEIIGFTSVLHVKGTRKVLNTFRGIPYAESPTDSRRFRKPVPKARFPSPVDASKYGPACYQFLQGQKGMHNVTFSEDCLSLNIFAPGQAPISGGYPVMVYIHGGGFVQGYTLGYEAGYLSLSGDVIVVTMNYRLNVFGFLYIDDPNAGGNFGLWDQQLAIKWVHDNIQDFGGDPNRITIFGESAGAASVTYQAIYPGNVGLIQRVVSESGSFAGPWAIIDRNDAMAITSQFAAMAGCLQNNTNTIINCLQSKSAEELKIIMDGPALEKGISVWKPVVDGEFILDDPSLLMSNHSSLRNMEAMFLGIDLIIGINSKEGFSNFASINETTKINVNKSEINNRLIPDLLTQFQNFNKHLPESVKNAVILEYTDWDNLNNTKKQFDRLIDMITDYWFSAAAAETALKHAASHRHTYVYKLSVAPPRHVIPVYASLDGPTVTNHADDLTFIFGPWFKDRIKIPDGLNKSFAEQEINTGKAMVTMWTNFAKTG